MTIRFGVVSFAHKEMGLLLNSSTMLAAEATTEIYGDEGVIIQNYGDVPSSGLPRPAGALKLFRNGRRDPLATAKEGKVCIEMVLGAYQSAREGRRVPL